MERAPPASHDESFISEPVNLSNAVARRTLGRWMQGMGVHEIRGVALPYVAGFRGPHDEAGTRQGAAAVGGRKIHRLSDDEVEPGERWRVRRDAHVALPPVRHHGDDAPPGAE